MARHGIGSTFSIPGIEGKKFLHLPVHLCDLEPLLPHGSEPLLPDFHFWWSFRPTYKKYREAALKMFKIENVTDEKEVFLLCINKMIFSIKINEKLKDENIRKRAALLTPEHKRTKKPVFFLLSDC
jgi:hypothetical protein